MREFSVDRFWYCSFVRDDRNLRSYLTGERWSRDVAKESYSPEFMLGGVFYPTTIPGYDFVTVKSSSCDHYFQICFEI